MPRPALLAIGLGLAALSCGHPDRPALNEKPVDGASERAKPTEAAGDLRIEWADRTESPRSEAPTDPITASLVKACGEPDAALAEVALLGARRSEAGLAALEPDEIVFALRARGAPYVWPRAWTLGATALSDDEIRGRFSEWLGGAPAEMPRRCGISIARGKRVAASAVVANAPADLSAIPVRARVGQWLRIEARLSAPDAQGASVVVLGPRGVPQAIPTTLADGLVKATFAPPSPGRWLVQLVAALGEGPRPVLEAIVFADVEPPARFRTEPAPGESAESASPTDTLGQMANAARASEGLAPLARDERLDGLALAHANAMQTAGRIAHDVGDGTPDQRLTAAGLSPSALGENVAHASGLIRAHRTLWWSPSHRGNLLSSAYDSLGVGVAVGPGGEVWVCELFGRLGRGESQVP